MDSPTPDTPRRSRLPLWDLLTFDRLLTGPVVHIIYWCGLGIIVLIGFAIIGAVVGLSIRGEGIEKLVALPALVGGGLAVLAMALLWRAVCEFYVAMFRISDDLHALRRAELGD